MNVRREIEHLRRDLERHNRLYYDGQPEITDHEFDQMMRDIQQSRAPRP